VGDLLQDVAESHADVEQEPEPQARLRSLGESGLDFELLAWIREPALRGRVLHALNSAVYKRLVDEGIEIPYPKRDVYLHRAEED